MKLLERLKRWWQIRMDIWMGRRCSPCSEDVSSFPVWRITNNRGMRKARFCSKGHEVPVPCIN